MTLAEGTVGVMFDGVVAIDGPGGVGKSTTSRRLASLLNSSYLDTGAMYRAVTWAVLHRDIDPADASKVLSLLETLAIEVGTDPAAPTIAVDGVSVEHDVRSERVTASVSAVANLPEVRKVLVAQQQGIIREACEILPNGGDGDAQGGIVVEGRDIGTVVAPDAAVKIYLTASEAVRAARRQGETLTAKIDTVSKDLNRRDNADTGLGRAENPETAARDAVILDTSSMAIDEVVTRIHELVIASQR